VIFSVCVHWTHVWSYDSSPQK